MQTHPHAALRPAAFSLAALALGAALALSGPAHAETATEIVAAADQVRNPDRAFRSTDTLTEYVSGKPKGQNVVVVYAKLDPATRQFRNLIQFAQPARDAGKMVLLDNRAFWFYDPASKASVRISPQQRLTGQAAVADVLTVNLSLDYAATLSGEETIQDAEHKDRACARLDLKASNPLATYNRIEYWIEKGTNYPIKAKFYSDSGRLLKILYYRGFHPVLGRVRPGEAVIIDAVSSSLVTTVTFGDLAFQDIPETWFQRDFLPRLQAK
jgi:outer membrane lipoprotein-sorting protein